MEIINLILGPVQTNSYLISDGVTGEAAVIDPAWDGDLIVNEAELRKWRITQLWISHAHFDHLGGVAKIVESVAEKPSIALHPDDQWLWEIQGGAPLFGLKVDVGPKPTIDLQHGQKLHLGELEIEVLHSPGHTPGHVIFYCSSQKIAFCGDVIFRTGIGRTDLPGGSTETLLASIRNHVLTMNESTRLLSGHGPETTVGYEKRYNPFLWG
jgi:hydroxyacylglutathione hydrolase